MLFKSKNMWLTMGQYFCSNFTFFFALTWLFPHIKSFYNLDTVEAGIGFACAAIGLVGSIYMNTATGAVIFLSLAIFGADMTLPSSWAFCTDIGKEHSGAVSGTMNMAGNIGAFITALIFPYLLSWTGNSNLFFIVGAILNVIAIVLWFYMKPQKHFTEY